MGKIKSFVAYGLAASREIVYILRLRKYGNCIKVGAFHCGWTINIHFLACEPDIQSRMRCFDEYEKKKVT